MLRNLGEYVSGRIGNVVFVRTKTKSYVRAAPNCSKVQWTEQQKLYRQRMSNVSALWRSLKSEMFSPIWRKAADGMNGYAWFVKLNIHAFNIDGTLIDPELILVTDGPLVSPQKLTAERVVGDPSSIRVNWQNDPHLKPERLHDSLMAMSYREGTFSAITPTGLKRGDLSGSFSLPQVPGSKHPANSPTHLFLFMVSGDGLEGTQSLSFAIPVDLQGF